MRETLNEGAVELNQDTKLRLTSAPIKFRLGVATTDFTGARSLLRQLGPLHAMAREDCRLEIVEPKLRQTEHGFQITLDWDFFSACDAVMLLDPFTDQHLGQIALARSLNVPVWAEYIDDLLTVRRSNPNWVGFSQRDRIKENIKQIMEWAAVVTTTNETLRLRLPLPDRAVVVPEACHWPAWTEPRRKAVSWRGMGSHMEDVVTICEQVREIAHLPQFSKWQWLFMGEVPYQLADAVPKDNLIWVPVHPPHQWMQLWRGMAPYLHIVPLPDNEFNRSKSPVAWLEATAVGAAVVGPDLPEWEGCAGMLKYKTPDEFGKALRRNMETFSNGAMHPNVEASRKDIYPAKTLEAVNVLRWAVIRKLQKATGD